MIQVFLSAFDTLLKIPAEGLRLFMMRFVLLLCFLFPAFAEAQFLSEESLISRLKAGPIPEEIMSKRTVVLHTGSITAKEIGRAHV